MSTLSLIRLSKTYLGAPAVLDITCGFEAGEIVGLVGKNGAGKSTLIRMLAGVTSPDEGEIRLNGEAIRLASVKIAQLHGLAFVHQELNDIPALSIAENIFLGEGYPRRFGLIDRRALFERARCALALVRSNLDPKRSVASLSVAERRLVMIASALARSARILILDEPTASLTDNEVDALHDLLRMLRGQGFTIIYVSHRLQEILSLTDRTMVMRDGRLVGISRTADLDEAALVREITGKAADRPELAGAKCVRKGSISRLALTHLRLSPTAKPIAIDVCAGEILGIAGLVGSGRTEILRILAGADQNPTARMSIDERPVKVRSPRQALAHGIALVPEDRSEMGAIYAFSVTENITIGTLARHRITNRAPFPARSSETKAASAFIDRLKIKTPSGASSMRTLSGGNQQKTILARCLAANVRWLLLDEPTHGVDVDARHEILALVRDLAANGVGIVYVSSDFQELLQASTRIVVLRERELVAIFQADAVTEADLLARCYADEPFAPAGAVGQLANAAP